MNRVCSVDKCTGCTACFNVCPQGAITMAHDEEGFMFSSIDEKKCIDCMACVKVCPVRMPVPRSYPFKCSAAVLKDKENLKCSASGGIATAMSETFINKGGVVYGCSGMDIKDIHHVRISSLSKVCELRGSKYVQSRLDNIYKKVKDDLSNGVKVLFIGTPCQVAGLKSFLKKEFDSLFTVDLVCHGVPSQQLLNDNIGLYQTNHKNLSNVHFRIKTVRRAIRSLSPKIEFGLGYTEVGDDKSVFVPYYKDLYMYGFLRGLFFRESCYSCSYANPCRVSDLTIGDFWGLPFNSKFQIGNGVSLILINTLKGEQFYNTIDTVDREEHSVMDAIRGNGQLQFPSQKNAKYSLFKKLYMKCGFEKAAKKCLKSLYFKEKYSNIKTSLKVIVKFVFFSKL